MKTLTYNSDTRIAQSLIVDDRLSEAQLEKSLSATRRLKRIAEREVDNRSESVLLDILDQTEIEYEIELLCRQIEDAECQAIALQHQIELEGRRDDERLLTIARRLSIHLNSTAQLLDALHGKLFYKMSALKRFSSN
jgi:hypothetical protein